MRKKLQATTRARKCKDFQHLAPLISAVNAVIVAILILQFIDIAKSGRDRPQNSNKCQISTRLTPDWDTTTPPADLQGKSADHPEGSLSVTPADLQGTSSTTKKGKSAEHPEGTTNSTEHLEGTTNSTEHLEGNQSSFVNVRPHKFDGGRSEISDVLDTAHLKDESGSHERERSILTKTSQISDVDSTWYFGVVSMQPQSRGTTSTFADVGPGCCAARDPTKMLFKGMVNNLNKCKEACQTLAKCGAIEFGWNSSNWCTVIPQGTDCTKVASRPEDCGDGGGDNGVHTYVFSALGEDLASIKAKATPGTFFRGSILFFGLVLVLVCSMFLLVRCAARYSADNTATQLKGTDDVISQQHGTAGSWKRGSSSRDSCVWMTGCRLPQQGDMQSARSSARLSSALKSGTPRGEEKGARLSSALKSGTPRESASESGAPKRASVFILAADSSESSAESDLEASDRDSGCEAVPLSEEHPAELDPSQGALPLLSNAPEIRYKDDFVVTGLSGSKNTFCWVSPKEAQEQGLAQACAVLGSSSVEHSELFEPIAAPWTPQALLSLLCQHSVDATKWEPSTVEQLAVECASENCFLMMKGDSIIRVIDFISMVIVHEVTGCVFVADSSTPEFTTEASQYRKMIVSQEVLPTMRKQAGERLSQTADRCLVEKLGVPSHAIKFDWGNVKTVDMEEAGDYFQGLNTVVRRSVVKGTIATTDKKILSALGAHTDSLSLSSYKSTFRGQMFQWHWKSIDKVPELMKYRSWLKSMQSRIGGTVRATQSPPGSGRKSPRKSMSTSGLGGGQVDVSTIFPWTEEAVAELLEEFNCNAEDFGMSLAELAMEAAFGSRYFCKRLSDSKLTIVQDQVMLRVISPQGQGVLALKHSNGTLHWPSTFRRLDEMSWDAVRRLSREQFGLQDDSIEFCLTPQELNLDAQHPEITGDRQANLDAQHPEITGDRQVRRAFLMSGHIPEAKTKMCENLRAEEFSVVRTRFARTSTSV